MTQSSERPEAAPTRERSPGGRHEPASPEARGSAPPEELALVGRLLAGDEAAFTTLVRRHQAALTRLALVFVADRETAEEVVQETWLAVLNGLAAFEGRSALKTWIFRILVNRARTRGAREARSIPLSSIHESDPGDDRAVAPDRFGPGGAWIEPPRPWSETPEGLLLRGETVALLQQAIRDLPPTMRAVVTLRDLEGLGAADTCNALDISETNQRVLLHRARARLRTALERHFAGD
ncbi:MAG: RNA polymerase sigma factor [Candidatus Polarisedimenticolia bacterium]